MFCEGLFVMNGMVSTWREFITPNVWNGGSIVSYVGTWGEVAALHGNIGHVA